MRGRGGGWLRNVTVAEYAALLDDKCGHPYYSHVDEVDKAREFAAAGQKQ